MLGHGQGTDLLSRKKTRQEALFLFGRSIQGELVDAELRVRSVGETDAPCKKTSVKKMTPFTAFGPSALT